MPWPHTPEDLLPIQSVKPISYGDATKFSANRGLCMLFGRPVYNFWWSLRENGVEPWVRFWIFYDDFGQMDKGLLDVPAVPVGPGGLWGHSRSFTPGFVGFYCVGDLEEMGDYALYPPP